MTAVSANGGQLDGGSPELSKTPVPPVTDQTEGLPGDRALVGINEPTDLSASLLPLLEALGWQGDPHEVAEALPHFVEDFDITSLRNVLVALGYQSDALETKLSAFKPDMLPSLFLPEGREALVLLSLDADHMEAFDSAVCRYVQMPREDWIGTAYFFSPLDADKELSGDDAGDWFRGLGGRFKGLAYQTFGITLLLNLLALAAPLFVMAVYDMAIAGGSAGIMPYLAVGAGIAVLCDMAFRSVRSRIFSFVGARLDHIVGIEVFRKILHLPASLIERAVIGAQVSQIRDFETVRKFFAGPLAPVLFELPFVLVFIAVIAYLGGSIAIVPIVMLSLTGVIGLAAMPKISETVTRAASSARQKQELTVETLNGMRAVKYCGAEVTWLRRYRSLSAQAALQGFHSTLLSSLLETLSYVVMVVAGFATVALGVGPVQEGDMTLGALVACLILVWRALQPLQTGLASLTRLTQMETGVDHLNSLMGIRRVGGVSPLARSKDRVKGSVMFSDVSIRYEQDSPPALEGVNFDIRSGKIVAVLGSNGAGKSTLLKLLAGIYQPDEGSIQIDNRDIRDISAAELRQSIAYVPQTPQFFYGTIAQNLRLANPTATDDDLRLALRQAGALEDIEALEQGSGEWKRSGWDVRLGDRGAGQASPGLLQRLNLARGYLKRAPIVLLDEPGNGLDIKGDQALLRVLANLRGQTTVFIVTHRPSHLKMADKIIWLEYGSVRSVGRPKVVMQKTRGML
jgi:ATP-binding cassette subfamily C protein/ATP-binding cassette subfamily C protein LapB